MPPERKSMTGLIVLFAVLAVFVVALAAGLIIMKTGVLDKLSDKVDVSDCYSVKVSGFSPYATAAVKVDNDQIYEITGVPYSELKPYIQVSIDKSSGIANGDSVTLHFDFANDKLKDDYGLKLSGKDQKFGVNGLKETTVDIASLTESDFSEAEKTVKELVSFDVGNQNELIPGGTLKDLDYEGCVLLVPKSGLGDNLLVAIYEAKAAYPYGNEQTTDNYDLSRTTEQEITYYTGIVLSGVTQKSGKLSYNSIDTALVAPDATVTVDGGYNYRDQGRLYYGFVGFKTEKEIISAIKKIYGNYSEADTL